MSLDQILAALEDGEERRHLPTKKADQEWRYYHHSFNHVYPIELMQRYGVIGQCEPTPRMRGISYVPLSDYAPGPLSFKGRDADLVDYYSWGPMTILISDRFHSIVQGLDPDGLESRPYAVVMASGEERRFWAAMSARVLDAIDLEATPFVTRRRPLYSGSSKFLSDAVFTEGCVFRDDITNGVASFVDFNGRQWVWSDKLIEALVIGGVRGFYADAPCLAKSSPDRIRL